MPRKLSSRKYQLTINNPHKHDLTHEQLKQRINLFASVVYWCMCDEIGIDCQTLHTHIYLVFKNSVMFDTVQKRFYGAHIEIARGNNQENYDYIRKQGKWVEDKKEETNLPETFEESGDLPADTVESKRETAEIYEMIKQNASNYDILERFPNAMNRLDKIEKARQEYLREQYKNEFRQLETTYIFGPTGTGKTRSVMEKYGYSNVYRITNYQHPFDGYKGEDVILFDEFRGNLPLDDMLKYLDGYPVSLPCRYSDKDARFTKVYFCTNIPLEKQYVHEQYSQPETWQAFNRRIHIVCQMQKNGKIIYPDLPFDNDDEENKIQGECHVQ